MEFLLLDVFVSSVFVVSNGEEASDQVDSCLSSVEPDASLNVDPDVPDVVVVVVVDVVAVPDVDVDDDDVVVSGTDETFDLVSAVVADLVEKLLGIVDVVDVVSDVILFSFSGAVSADLKGKVEGVSDTADVPNFTHKD